ncbi:MAG: hypothetical protein QXI37_01525 [Thermoprotei archaeon]
MRKNLMIVGVTLVLVAAVTVFFIVPLLADNPSTGVRVSNVHVSKGTLTLMPGTANSSKVLLEGNEFIVNYSAQTPVPQWLTVAGRNQTPVDTVTRGESTIVGYRFKDALNTTGTVYFYDNESSKLTVTYTVSPLTIADPALISGLAAVDPLLFFAGVALVAASLFIKERVAEDADTGLSKRRSKRT